MVYENDDKGTKLNGDFATLVKALTKGAEIRVRLPFYGVVAPLQNVRPVYFSVCGQIIFNMEKNGYDRFQVSVILLLLNDNIIEPGHVIPTMWHFEECRLRQACAAPI